MRRYVHFRLGLVLCCLAVYLGTMAVPGTHTKAAPGASEPIAQQVTVSPAKVFFGERLEITVKGFPPDYTLPAGSVTFAGLRLPVPGYFGAPGERPKSDVLGNLTFRTYLPMDTPLGSQLLIVAMEPVFIASTTLEFPGAPLSLSPTSAVANQEIQLSGTGFSSASVRGGSGPLGVHQITGRGQSVITLGGDVLRAPYVNYPIDLDRDGNLLTKMFVRASKSTARAGKVALQITDSGGRAGIISLTIPNPEGVFSPITAYPGDLIRLQGQGFQASNPALLLRNTVDIEYRYVVNQGTASQYYVVVPLGQSTVDRSGTFDTEFTVPREAGVPSSNLVALTPKQGEPIIVAHTVPSPAITVSPTNAFNTQAVEITVKGLPPNYTLPAGAVTLSGVRMPLPGYFGVPGIKPKTNNNGQASFKSRVPEQAPMGFQQLVLLLPAGVQLTTTLKVLTATLSVTPEVAVPGQIVTVGSTDLSPAAAGAPGPFWNHQISGTAPSLVTIRGARVGSRDVSYPIDLDRLGGASFSLTVPINDTTLVGGTFEIKVVDTGGRTGVGSLIIKRPTLTVSPGASTRGSLVKVVGEGFVATTGTNSATYWADIEYDGQKVATVVTNSRGSFQANIVVPVTTAPGSTNRVTATLRQLSMEARASHVVPGPAISIYPKSGPPGTILTITGSGFPGFTSVLPILNGIGLPQSPPVYTDNKGNFTVFPLLPVVPPGNTFFGVKVGQATTYSLFEVTE